MKVYDYGSLTADIKRLAAEFPELEWGSIGKSVWGKQIYYIKLGNGENVISFNGAHHGMEWITSALLMKFASEYLKKEMEEKSFRGIRPRMLSKKTSLYIIPMVNPDGVELATKGIPEELDAGLKENLVKMNGTDNFGRWQANAKGVDLNHNYDASWEKSRAMESEYGIFGPGPTRYSGEFPFSEPESRALANFTREKDFGMILAFHSQGKVIYQGFNGREPAVSLKIAKAFECISPYRVDEAEGMASCGGYKDWFVDKFRRTGFTVEVGEGRNPLPLENLPIIYKETLPIMLGAMMV